MASSVGVARTIIHIDLDAFYCAVEEQRDPMLRGRAFAVGGRADERGVAASCSYAARSFGVRSAMAMGMAQRLCPHLLVVPTRHAHYRAVSHSVMELLRSFTPKLEQLSIDEAFLDATELLADENDPALAACTLALEIQRRVFEELGLSCSLGVASNKMVAKIANDCGKASAIPGRSPQALCVVEAGKEADFLAPLPVSALWGVGPKTESALLALGIETIGDLARWNKRDLAQRFGKHGVEMARHARGIDLREVVTERETKSISSETTFLLDVADWETLHSTLCEQAQSVAATLQEQKLRAATVKIKLRWSDFTYSNRQTTLTVATDVARVIEEAATSLLSRLWLNAVPVRLLGVGVSGLSPVRQLGLFDHIPQEDAAPTRTQVSKETRQQNAVALVSENAEPEGIEPDHHLEARRQRLQEALAELEARFGNGAIHLGARPNSQNERCG